MKPKTLILRTAGTNCEAELAHAFELAGARVEMIHLHRLIENPSLLGEADLLGLPGGFSYGDDIAAGRIFANLFRHRLYPALREFVAGGRPVIGICNGFQLLVKSGLLPGFDLPEDRPPDQLVTLADNADPCFVDRWTHMRVEPNTACVWTKGLDEFDLPIAHGEGRFVAAPQVLDRLEQGQVVLRYNDNPNGSQRDIAGICDPSGLVFGLMPHPERFTDAVQHPRWTRQKIDRPAGLSMFENAVRHVGGRTSVTA